MYTFFNITKAYESHIYITLWNNDYGIHIKRPVGHGLELNIKEILV